MCQHEDIEKFQVWLKLELIFGTYKGKIMELKKPQAQFTLLERNFPLLTLTV